jgi:hypothetical protein
VLNINQGELPMAHRVSVLDASGLLMSAQTAITQGIAMSGASSALRHPVAPRLRGIGTEPCAAAPSLPRPWVDSVYSPGGVEGYALAAQRLGRAATNHNSNSTISGKQYATSINVAVVGGVGTSGPPRRQ